MATYTWEMQDMLPVSARRQSLVPRQPAGLRSGTQTFPHLCQYPWMTGQYCPGDTQITTKDSGLEDSQPSPLTYTPLLAAAVHEHRHDDRNKDSWDTAGHRQTRRGHAGHGQDPTQSTALRTLPGK